MTQLYKVDGDGLVPITTGKIGREEMVEGWVAAQPELLGLDMLVIGRQVITDFGGRIDLLGIDADGDLVLVELKRDRTPREVIAQVLDYASWIVGLKTPQIHDIALKHLRRPLADAFRERFGGAPPETLNAGHQMMIVASAFDAASQRIVRYLAEVHDIAINTAFFSVFDHGGETLLATDWLMDQAEVTERSEAKTRAPWSGLWYVNIGEGPHRAWDDMRRYGFVSAGGGPKYSGPLLRLQAGDHIVAYQKGHGYVGYGRVTAPAVPASDLQTPGGPLLDQPLAQPNLFHDRDDPVLADYAVAVDWQTQVPFTEAKWAPGLFANQNIVCKLRDQKTIDFLTSAFGFVL